MKLSPQQRQELHEALIDAFPTKASLERMLSFKLDRNLEAIAGVGTLEDIVFELIKAAESQGWISDLIRSAHNSNSGNSKLRDVAQKLQIKVRAAPSTQQEENRKQLLNALKHEVTSRLSQSLHNAVLIELGKELQPAQVKRPWDVEVKIGVKPNQPLPHSTNIIDVFNSEEIAGKLLILGAPGSGKTTTLLELSKLLIEKAEKEVTHSIPVLLNLSSWKDPQQEMNDWLVEELNSKYGVKGRVSKQWFEEKKILLLLDGLDEVKVEYQESCLKAINQLLQSEYRPLHLVVCSRQEEYEMYSTQLQLNGAILLQNITDSQIQDYLTEINRADIWQIVQADKTLLELLEKPLFLSIMVLAYSEFSPDKWQQANSKNAHIKLLLSAYVQRMLVRGIRNESNPYFKPESRTSRQFINLLKPPNSEQTQAWLIYLAQQLQQESQTEFLIERIQPSWLLNKQQELIYILATGVISGLITASFVALFFDSIGGLYAGMVNALTAELNIIRPVDFFGITLKNKEDLKRFNRAIMYQIYGQLYVPIFSSFLGLLGVVLGLELVNYTSLNALKRDPDIKTCITPNQGVFNSAKNAFLFAFFSLVIIPFEVYMGTHFFKNSIFSEPNQSANIEKKFYILLIFLAWIKFLLAGGQVCIKHFTLRFILYFNGCIPWNYARFLNYCTDCVFLQRVGGRYRFIHKMLQEYFANMEFERH